MNTHALTKLLPLAAISVAFVVCGCTHAPSATPSAQFTPSPASAPPSPSATPVVGYRSLAHTFGRALFRFTLTQSSFEPSGAVSSDAPVAFTAKIMGASMTRHTLTFDVVQTYRWGGGDISSVVRNRYVYAQTLKVEPGLRVIVFGDAAQNFDASANPVPGDMTTVSFGAFVRHYRSVIGTSPLWLGLAPSGRIGLIAIPFHS
jgi:hypothetical protein